MPVPTSKVKGRRTVEYQSLQDVVADAERVAAGPVHALGNWSAGQIFRHLALAYNGSIDGLSFRLPWPMQFMARLLKKRIVKGPMPAGFKLPAEGEKALDPGTTSTEQGLAELRAAVDRLEREPKRAPHPAFGPLSPQEWNQIHLHHAALHMSFLVPDC